MKKIISILIVSIISCVASLAQSTEQLNDLLIKAINKKDIPHIIEYCENGADLTIATEKQIKKLNIKNFKDGTIIMALSDSLAYEALTNIGEFFCMIANSKQEKTQMHLFLGNYYALMQDLSNAEIHYRCALEINADEPDSILMHIHEVVYSFYKLTNNIHMALQEWDWITPRFRENNFPKFLTYYIDLGRLGIRNEKYEEAEKIFLEVKEFLENNHLENSEEYYLNLYNLAELHMNSQNYDSVAKYCMQISDSINANLELKETKLFGRYSYVMAMLADAYGMPDLAERKFADAITNLSKYDDENYYAQALLHAASFYGTTIGDIETATTLFNKLRYNVKRFVVPSLFYAQIDEFEACMLAQVDPKRAIKILETNLNYYETNSAEYVRILSNIALANHSLGNFTEAISIMENIITSDKIQLVPKENHAILYNNLSQAYRTFGVLDKAEEYCEIAMKKQASYAGYYTPTFALLSANDGMIKYDLGNYWGAYYSSMNALEIYDSLQITQSAYLPIVYNNLGLVYENIEKPDSAILYFNKAIDYYQEINPYSTVLPAIYSNISLHFWNAKEYKEALDYNLKALQICEHNGIKDQAYLYTLTNRGQIYAMQKDFEAAIEWDKKALAACDTILDKSHTLYSRIQQNVLSDYFFDQQNDSAYAYLYNEFYNHKTNVYSAFNFLSEEQRNLYWQEASLYFEMIYPSMSVSLSKHGAQTYGLMYDNELFMKGLLLKSSMAIEKSIKESGDSILLDLYAQHKILKEKIANKDLLSQSSLDSISYYEWQLSNIDKELTRRSKAYRMGNLDYRWQDVQSQLKDNDVAIEFGIYYEYSNYIFDSLPKLYALILRNNSLHPQLVTFGYQQKLADLLRNPNSAYSYSISSNILYNELWEPLSHYVASSDKIYYAPSAILHKLNLDAILINDSVNVGDIYKLKRVSSTRDLVEDSSRKIETAALYGGISYDLDTTVMQYSAEQYINTFRSIDLDDFEFDSTRSGVRYLPGTLREVNYINSLLSTKTRTELYTEEQANEESFKALSGKNIGVLHIATHGFFFSNEKANKKQLFKQQLLTSPAPKEKYINPLSRSGLLMAGANLTYTGHRDVLPNNVEDGILTSKEISSIDLSGVDMVVLSACETGQGDITGDGVFGLQRAFKQAGVKTIIMSLWKVNDSATQLFMTEFYRNWITLGQSKLEAFRNARNTVRLRYEEPEYWAGFIMLD